MSSCVKVLCVTATIMNTRKKTLLVVVFFFFFFFQFKQLQGVVSMALNPLFCICVIKKKFVQFLELLSASCWLSRATGSQYGF